MEQPQQGRAGPVTRCRAWAQQSCSSWPLDDRALVSWPCVGARETWVSSAILDACLYPGAWEVVAVVSVGVREEQRVSKITFLCQLPPGAKIGKLTFVQHPRIHSEVRR